MERRSPQDMPAPVALSENLIFVGDGTSGSNAAGEYTFYRYQASPFYSFCPLCDPTKAVSSGATIPIKLPRDCPRS